ncbi:MAG: M48 family metalloprotease [Prochlorothrix sp.]|nr:M48 family metalloprotease [Prochlorothrix sp.]
MTHRHFHGLQANVYEHPFDSRARKSLEKTPGLSLVFKKINEYGIDRLFRFRCTANAIRITYRNFPTIYSAFETACETLAVDPVPALYLIHGEGYIRTLTIGVNEPIVIVNVDAIERLTEQEWLYVLGHELGHIKSSHLLYHQTAIVLPVLGKFIASSTLGLGGIATNGIELALYQWMMMAKLTCDRAGLLACQDTTVATRALIKLAGLPEEYLSQAVVDEFLDQSREFGGYDLDNLDKITKILSFAENMRPWVILRSSELLKWIDGGVYNSIVEGTYLFLEGDGHYDAASKGVDRDRGGSGASGYDAAYDAPAYHAPTYGGYDLPVSGEDADADWGLEDWGSAGPRPAPQPGPRPSTPRPSTPRPSTPRPSTPRPSTPRPGNVEPGNPVPVTSGSESPRGPQTDRDVSQPAAANLGSLIGDPSSDRLIPSPSAVPLPDPLGAPPPLAEDWSPAAMPLADSGSEAGPTTGPRLEGAGAHANPGPGSERPPDRPSERGKGRRRWDPERFGMGINGDGAAAPRRDRPPLEPDGSSRFDPATPPDQPPIGQPPIDRPPISLPDPKRSARNHRPPIDSRLSASRPFDSRLPDSRSAPPRTSDFQPPDSDPRPPNPRLANPRPVGRPGDLPRAPRTPPDFSAGQPLDRPPLPPLSRPNATPTPPSDRPRWNNGTGNGVKEVNGVKGINGTGYDPNQTIENRANTSNSHGENEGDWEFLDSWKIS